jgi:glutathione S-transferase
MNSSYSLYYFPGNGRAAVSRAILTYANAKWENKKVFGEDFANLQKSGNLEYWAVPALEIDGKKWLSQSLAIETYLSKKFNLLGDSDEDEYEILNLLCSREDIMRVLVQLLFPTEEQKAKREEIAKTVKEQELPFYFKVWEKKYNQHHGKYFLGDKFTLADIFVTVFCELFNLKFSKDAGFDSLFATYAPNLAAHCENIKNNELAGYFKDVYSYDSNF